MSYRTFTLIKVVAALCIWFVTMIAIKSDEQAVAGYVLTLFASYTVVKIILEYMEESEDNK